MKLVITVVNVDDETRVREHLIQKGYGATTLSSQGNFLQQENRTLITGVADDKVQEVISLIRSTVHRRETPVTGRLPVRSMLLENNPQITVSGATIFVVDVERFLRV